MDVADGGDILNGAVRPDVALRLRRGFVFKQRWIASIEALENVGGVHVRHCNGLKTAVFVAEFQRVSVVLFGKGERPDVGESGVRADVVVFNVLHLRHRHVFFDFYIA